MYKEYPGSFFGNLETACRAFGKEHSNTPFRNVHYHAAGDSASIPIVRDSASTPSATGKRRHSAGDR